MPERYVQVGEVVGVFGIKGWIKVVSHTQPRNNIVRYQPWRIPVSGRERTFSVDGSAFRGKAITVHLEGIDDRDVAAGFVGAPISVARQSFSPEGNNEFYWADLIGLSVVTETGEALGSIDRMLETGANDVMVVTGERRRLIPFTLNDVVMRVDLADGVVVVAWDPQF